MIRETLSLVKPSVPILHCLLHAIRQMCLCASVSIQHWTRIDYLHRKMWTEYTDALHEVNLISLLVPVRNVEAYSSPHGCPPSTSRMHWAETLGVSLIDQEQLLMRQRNHWIGMWSINGGSVRLPSKQSVQWEHESKQGNHTFQNNPRNLIICISA